MFLVAFYPFQIHLGGVDTFLQPGKVLNVRNNFRGCMENVWWNYMNIIKDTRMLQDRFESHGGVQYGTCQVSRLNLNPGILTPRPHRARSGAAQRKKWKIFHCLHCVATAAVCVNTLLDNSCFHFLRCVMQTLRYITRCITHPVWTRCQCAHCLLPVETSAVFSTLKGL